MTPTTVPAKRLATLFRRRLITHWNDREVKRYKTLVKQGAFETLDDLVLVETYYVFNEKKPDNFLRRDLYTLLNNWHGEVDRARAWALRNKAKVKKSNPHHQFRETNEPTEAEWQRSSEIVKEEMAKLKQQLFRT